MREILTSREVVWTLVGVLAGFAVNRFSIAYGST
jgi:hypothetical protein